MKKILSLFILTVFVGLALFTLSVKAQTTTLPTGPAELPLGPEDSTEEESSVESTADSATSEVSKDDTESFVIGVLVGGSFGFIVGAVLSWAFTDKFLS